MKKSGKDPIVIMSSMTIYIATILMWITLPTTGTSVLSAATTPGEKLNKESSDEHDHTFLSEEKARAERGVRRTNKKCHDWFCRKNTEGVCPANKNAHVLYITTHDSDNIYSFDSFGRFLGPVMNFHSFPKSVEVKKLRGVKFGPDGLLYVSSGKSSYSRIFAVSPNGLSKLVQAPSSGFYRDDGNGKHTLKKRKEEEKTEAAESNDENMRGQLVSGTTPGATSITDDIAVTTHMYLPIKHKMSRNCTRNYVYTLSKIDHETNPNLDHPYDFLFHPDNGVLFASNQNSLTVTRYVGPTTTLAQISKIIDESVAVLTTDKMEREELRDAYMDNMILISKKKGGGKDTMKEEEKKDTSSTPKLFNFQLSPVEIGDPMPFSGGVSGLAGLPLPMPPNLFKLIEWEWNGGTTAHPPHRLATPSNELHIPKQSTPKPQKRSQGAMLDLLFGRGKIKGSRSASASINAINTTSTIGVFAASWNSFYGLLSVRGIAISPPVAYNSNNNIFLHELRGRNADLYDNTGNAEEGKSFIEGFRYIRLILVADIISNSIHVFHEHTGELMWTYINIVPSPVQIHFAKSAERSSKTGDYWFYVTAKNGGVYKVLFKRQTTGDLHSLMEVMVKPKSPMKAGSGFFENPSHNNVYIADRKGRQILTYSTVDHSHTPKSLTFTGIFVKKLPDSPECVLYTRVESQVNIPFCYELTSSGYLHYSVLCRAAQIWVLMGFSLVVWVFLYWTDIGRNIRSGCCLTHSQSRKRRVKMESDSLSY